jgi:hypothetical protein
MKKSRLLDAVWCGAKYALVKNKLCGLAPLLFVMATGSQVAQATTAWSIDTPDPFRNGSWSFGEIFTVGGTDITVTSLGAFDANLDGFISSGGIPVGIYRESDSALLASTFVTSSDTLIGNYRFDSIAPLTLLADTSYRVVAVNLDDLYNITIGTPDSVDPRITWNGYSYCNTTTLTSCDDFGGTERTFMANFEVTVPVPPAVWLFGSGLIGLIGIARRKKVV